MLLRLLVPRLSGHSGQDTQAYKSAMRLPRNARAIRSCELREQLVPATISEESWRTLETRAREDVHARSVASSDVGAWMLQRHPHAFSEVGADGASMQQQGGLLSEGIEPREGTRPCMPKARASTWSRRSVARWSTSWR